MQAIYNTPAWPLLNKNTNTVIVQTVQTINSITLVSNRVTDLLMLN